MKNKVIFFTGLSGSGKSTISNYLKDYLPNVVVLDGDIMREGLNSDLGFSIEDRNENIRRLVEVSRLLHQCGRNVLVPAIMPFESQRIFAKERVPDSILVYLNTSYETCEERDVKGLYKKARDGELKEFTGKDSPFEEAMGADIIIDTDKLSIKDSVRKILEEIEDHPSDWSYNI